MKNFYSSLDYSDRWNTEMDLIKQYSNLVEEGGVIAKPSCYYPRLTNTNKRGRVAFVELYKKICCDGKTKLMSIDNFELFICKHKEWDVKIQPTDKHGKMQAEWILHTECNEYISQYLNNFEYLCTPNLPSISTEEHEQLDNVSAIMNLANNLNIRQNELIHIIKYFLERLEQLSLQGDSP